MLRHEPSLGESLDGPVDFNKKVEVTLFVNSRDRRVFASDWLPVDLLTIDERAHIPNDNVAAHGNPQCHLIVGKPVSENISIMIESSAFDHWKGDSRGAWFREKRESIAVWNLI